ncbi:hypothetical protein GCM10011414_05440 [Croceivirga lutea]|nr:hypothetical protein GCM10011414_05440 [Croceivirga lutea]
MYAVAIFLLSSEETLSKQKNKGNTKKGRYFNPTFFRFSKPKNDSLINIYPKKSNSNIRRFERLTLRFFFLIAFPNIKNIHSVTNTNEIDEIAIPKKNEAIAINITALA